MLAGVNDRSGQARALAAVLTPREAFKVNLIPYNPTGGEFEGSSRAAIEAFRAAAGRRAASRRRCGSPAGATSPPPAASSRRRRPDHQSEASSADSPAASSASRCEANHRKRTALRSRTVQTYPCSPETGTPLPAPEPV